MTKNNPKLTNQERRRRLYFQKWGLNEKNSTAGAVYTSKVDQVAYPIPGTAPSEKKADAEKKKNKLSKVIPKKIDVDGITKSRMFLEKMRGDFDHD